MLYSELQAALKEYNWDNGFALPQKLLDDPACDLALALEIFYLADGCAFLAGLGEENGPALSLWKEFISRLFDEIREGKYSQTWSAFSVPLNRVQRYKLKKSGVPEVFLTDLPVLGKSLEQAIEDSRRGENLIGPFGTAEEAVKSMLDD